MADTVAGPSADTIEKQSKEQVGWKWQLILRLFLFVLYIVDLALTAYAYNTSTKYFNLAYGGYYWDYNVYLFVPIGLGLLWVLVYLPLSFFLKHRLHPGFAVGFDLVLWLACITIGSLFLALSVYANSDLDPSYFGSSYGPERQGSPDSTTAIYNDNPYVYESNNGTSVVRDTRDINYPCPYYDSCAEQNRIYSKARNLNNVMIAAQIILLICGIMHFTLWVWACVDCARYNRNRSTETELARARLIAEEMVKGMRDRGEITAFRQEQGMSTNPAETDQAAHVSESGSQIPTALPSMSMSEGSRSKGKNPVRESNGVTLA